MIKKCSMLSDGGMSNTSEFNADERMIKYSNILQLAMNDVVKSSTSAYSAHGNLAPPIHAEVSAF